MGSNSELRRVVIGITTRRNYLRRVVNGIATRRNYLRRVVIRITTRRISAFMTGSCFHRPALQCTLPLNCDAASLHLSPFPSLQQRIVKNYLA